MKVYMAPLEGITGYIFRKTYDELIGGIDKYFTPFIVPQKKKKFKNKELKDILPENNEGMYVVPQILTNNSEDFLRTLKNLNELGYSEVNLNLGCPSGTVVSKKRGAGLLSELYELESLLDEIYSGTDCKISIKTRVGRYSEDEWEDILAVFEKYPVYELIIHPRIQQDFYKFKPRLKTFDRAYVSGRFDLVYNGDVFDYASYIEKIERYPKLDKIMLGRGLISNPLLTAQIKNSESPQGKSRRIREELNENKNSSVVLKQFHDRLFERYSEALSGDANVLYKMKELWFYFGMNIEGYEKEKKIIRKANRISEYKAAVNSISHYTELNN